MREPEAQIAYDGAPLPVGKGYRVKADGVVGCRERHRFPGACDGDLRIQNLENPFPGGLACGNKVIDGNQLPDRFVEHVCVEEKGEKLPRRETGIGLKKIGSHPDDREDAKG